MKDIRFKVWDKEDKVLGIVNDIDYLKKLIHLSVAESGQNIWILAKL